MRKIFLFLWVFILILIYPDTYAGNTQIGSCHSFAVEGNKVIFSCDNNSKLMLQFCSASVIKIWYEPKGVFARTNESFAVINEELSNIGNIQVSEQAASYEIYTEFLIVRIYKNPFQLRFYDKYQKLLLEDIPGKAFESDSNRIITNKNLRPDEKIVGLGEKSGSLNRRGKIYKMWNSDKPCYGVNEDPLYKSIPFFMSNYGYGIFFDNTFKSIFKFGSESSESYSFEAPGGEMLYYFIFGPDYKNIIQQYIQLTGSPIMPPKWALGFSQCRGLLTSENLSLEIAKGFRERQIPCDIIYQDIGWTENLQDFEWRKSNYSNPKQMLNDLATDGFKVVVSQDPVISQANKKQWNEADSLGYFISDVRSGKTYDMPWPWGGNCGVVDFTKPGVDEWWGNYQQKPINDGIQGFWTDMGEPAWSNEESTERLFMKHHAGMHDEIHNVYGFTWDRIVTQQFEKHNPNKRVFQMTRAAYAGLQRYTFGWSGDSGDGNNVLDGWNKLAGQVLVAQSAGLGIIPFWATDISGYCGDIKDYPAFSELYIRWLQFGAFNPLSRIHHEGNNAVEPWLFGEEATQICKKAIELKYQLFPYIYTYAYEAHKTGMPLVRPMFLEFPADEDAMKSENQFMFGKEMLVIPVTKKGARSVKVYLPEGNWFDFYSGKIFEGSQWIDYPVMLESIPLFVREGSIIPMMPVMQYIHEKENYPVYLKINPSNSKQEVSFDLYEDDGLSNDYKKGLARITRISCETQHSGIGIKINRLINNYQVSGKRNFILEIPMLEKPKEITSETTKLKSVTENSLLGSVENNFDKNCWSWDKASKKCYIKILDIEEAQKIIIVK